jgi:uncharacterized caspase-like protein
MTPPPHAGQQPPATGQQRERTRLAWRRTALASTVASLLASRLAVGTRLTAGGALAVAGVAALWLTTMAICQHRIGALAADRPVRASRAPAVLAAVVAGYALVGALIVVMRWG